MSYFLSLDELLDEVTHAASTCGLMPLISPRVYDLVRRHRRIARQVGRCQVSAYTPGPKCAECGENVIRPDYCENPGCPSAHWRKPEEAQAMRARETARLAKIAERQRFDEIRRKSVEWTWKRGAK